MCPSRKKQCWQWITSKDLLHSMWNSAHCYMAAWIGDEIGGEWIQVHVCLFAVHLKTITTLLTGYTTMQNKKLKKIKEKRKEWIFICDLVKFWESSVYI